MTAAAAVPDRPTLSVALATYNGRRYLTVQLASYVSQTRPPDEVVVRDDGSTDGTTAILERFAATAPFAVRVLPGGENLGYARNFERVIAACEGDLIALSDQDDVWLPHKLMRLQDSLGNDPERLLTFSDAELVDENLAPLGRTAWEAVRFSQPLRERVARGPGHTPFLWRGLVAGATACFRSSLVQLAGTNPLDVWHDGWLVLVAGLHGRVEAVDEPLILYRQHGHNVTGVPEARRGSLARRVNRAYELARRGGGGLGGAELVEGSRRMLAMLEHARERYAATLSSDADRALRRASDFHAFREDLPDHPRRLAALLRQLVAGRYRAYGDGWTAPAIDLLR